MMSNKFDKLHKKIIETVAKSPLEEDPLHSEQVREFVLDLYPKAKESLQIAALAHDIERGVLPRVERLKDESYEKHKMKHAKRSARITAKLMKDFGYANKFIKEVTDLIKLHEIGGNKLTDVLKDADSIVYFTNDIDFYLCRSGVERTKDKIKFSYNRASNRAKSIIRSFNYKNKIKKLILEVIKE